MIKMIAVTLFLFSFSIAGQAKSPATRLKPKMSCLEVKRNLSLTVFADQSGHFSVKIWNLSMAGEREIARFGDVNTKVFTNGSLPAEAYGTVDLDSGNMFFLGISDPTSGAQQYYGDLRTVIDGTLRDVKVDCRKVEEKKN